jgi:hypothetical protein
MKVLGGRGDVGVSCLGFALVYLFKGPCFGVKWVVFIDLNIKVKQSHNTPIQAQGGEDV